MLDDHDRADDKVISRKLPLISVQLLGANGRHRRRRQCVLCPTLRSISRIASTSTFHFAPVSCVGCHDRSSIRTPNDAAVGGLVSKALLASKSASIKTPNEPQLHAIVAKFSSWQVSADCETPLGDYVHFPTGPASVGSMEISSLNFTPANTSSAHQLHRRRREPKREFECSLQSDCQWQYWFRDKNDSQEDGCGCDASDPKWRQIRSDLILFDSI